MKFRVISTFNVTSCFGEERGSYITYFMAVRRVILSTASPSQNLASSLLDFANNDSLSTGEIYRTRKQTKSTFTSLGLCWTGDFESLKHFVADSLKLNGTWSQPGGHEKVFVAEDASIIRGRIKTS